MNDAARQIGAALGVAVLGSVLNSVYGAHIARFTTRLPSAAASAAGNSVGEATEVAAHLSGRAAAGLLDAANAAYMVGFSSATRVAVALVLAGTLLVLARMPAVSRLAQRETAAPPLEEGRAGARRQAVGNAMGRWEPGIEEAG